MKNSFSGVLLCAVLLSACTSAHDNLISAQEDKIEPIGISSAILAMLTMGKSEEKSREYEENEGEKPSFLRKTTLSFQGDEKENKDIVYSADEMRVRQESYDAVYHPVDAILGAATLGLYDARPELSEGEDEHLEEDNDEWFESELSEEHVFQSLYDERTILDKGVAVATLGLVQPNKPEPDIPEGSFTYQKPLVDLKLNQSTFEDVKEMLGAPRYAKFLPDGSVEGRFVTQPEKYRNVALIGDEKKEMMFYFNTEKVLVKVRDYVDPDTPYEDIWE